MSVLLLLNVIESLVFYLRVINIDRTAFNIHKYNSLHGIIMTVRSLNETFVIPVVSCLWHHSSKNSIPFLIFSRVGLLTLLILLRLSSPFSNNKLHASRNFAVHGAPLGKFP